MNDYAIDTLKIELYALKRILRAIDKIEPEIMSEHPSRKETEQNIADIQTALTALKQSMEE